MDEALCREIEREREANGTHKGAVVTELHFKLACYSDSLRLVILETVCYDLNYVFFFC